MPDQPRPPLPEDQAAERCRGVYAFDRGWQFPAITEQHAYRRVLELGGAAPGTTYVAYPWATLIDKLEVRAADAQTHLDSFRAFCLGLPEGTVKLTVCQHILMPAFRHLFIEAGISHVFWSHTTKQIVAEVPDPELQLHPFPLFPVQTPDGSPQNNAQAPRRWLYSFVGMRPNAWYLTQVRAWILDALKEDPRGHVIGRDNWHYKKIVYRHQVLDHAPKDADGRPEPGLVDDAASAQFREVLRDSTFALCPSGSGPNSIRLWEAIMAGSIPVIMADTYAPPGDPWLWEQAAVFCEETAQAVRELPDRLEAIAADPARLAALQDGVARLRLLYGVHGFVPDLAQMMQAMGSAPASLEDPSDLTERDATGLLLAQTTEQLLGRSVAVPGARVTQARALLTAEHPVVQHHDRITAQGVGSVPSIGRGAGPALYLAGTHGTPFHHNAMRRMAADQVAFVARPEQADLVVSADLEGLSEAGDTQAIRLVVSEMAVPQGADASDGNVVWLGHETSEIFRFDRLPYALICDDHSLPRLAGLLSASRDQTPEALCASWAVAPARAGLWWSMEAAGGEPPRRSVTSMGSLHGLAQAIAAVQTPGLLSVRVPSGAGDHISQLDRLSRLDGQAPVFAAFEATSHPGHVGLAAIEAIAMGGMAASVLAPGHRLYEVIPEAALIDISGLSPADMADRMLTAPVGLEQAAAVCKARADLRTRLARPRDVLTERQRVVAAVLREVFARV